MKRARLHPERRISPRRGLLWAAAAFALMLLISCSGHGGQPAIPNVPDVNRGGANAPTTGGGNAGSGPVSPPPGGAVLHTASGGEPPVLDGPTPYLLPVYPTEGAFVPEGNLTPLNIVFDVDDKLQVGIDEYGMTLDFTPVLPTYDAVNHQLTYSASGMGNGLHTVHASVRDMLGDLYERGFMFYVDASPPAIWTVAFAGGYADSAVTGTAFNITFHRALNPATVGNAAHWQILNPQGAPVTTVTSVTQYPGSFRVRVEFSPSLNVWGQYHVVLAYGEGAVDGYYGYNVHQAPGDDTGLGLGAGSGFAGGGLIGGDSFGGGGGDPPMYRTPGTPIHVCLCNPHPAACDGPNPPGGLTGVAQALAVDASGYTPPPPEDPPQFLYWWEHFDVVQEGEQNWWCSHFEVAPFWVLGTGIVTENYIYGELPTGYDYDMTHDVSWNGAPPTYAPNPLPVSNTDLVPWHQQPSLGACAHPDAPIAWNQGDWWAGYPPSLDEPFTPYWPRGGPSSELSRIISPCYDVFNQQTQQYERVHGMNVCNWQKDTRGCGGNAVVMPPDNIPPAYEPTWPKIVTGAERANFKSRYTNGIIIGTDDYAVKYNQPGGPAKYANDRFIEVVGFDPPGVCPPNVTCDPRELLVGSTIPKMFPDLHTTLVYARGDRAYLSQPSPPYGRVIDRLLATRMASAEDLAHECDWGIVGATYYVDEATYDVDPGNPPTEKPFWGFPHWQNDPHSNDVDRSPLFEKAVWYVPIPKECCGNDPNHQWPYFVRIDDNIGSWRIASIDPYTDGKGSRGDFTLTMLEPDPAQDRKQYVNLNDEKAGAPDWCNINGPPENGDVLCIAARIDGTFDPALTLINWYVQDQPYIPPEGDTIPTNPGVSNDFLVLKSYGWDNRGTDPAHRCETDPEHRPGVLYEHPVDYATQPAGFNEGISMSYYLTPRKCKTWLFIGHPVQVNGVWVTRLKLKFFHPYGGNNYTVFACANDNRAACTTPLITIWRKLYVPVDYMNGTDSDQPDYQTEIAGSVADGFYEIQATGPTARTHTAVLDQPLCGVDPNNSTWEPLEYAHVYATPYHNPPDNLNTPLHTFNLIGSHLSYEGAQAPEPQYGIYCSNDSHSWTFEDCIREVYDQTPPYHTCRVSSPPLTYDQLKWRTSVHEMAHNMGRGADPLWGDLCVTGPNQPCNSVCDDDNDGTLRESTDSLLDYDCAFDAQFGGWLNLNEILSMRKGETRQ